MESIMTQQERVKKLMELTIIFSQLKEELPLFDLPKLNIMRPKDSKHGDFSTDACFQIAKLAKMKPMEVGKILEKNMKLFI